MASSTTIRQQTQHLSVEGVLGVLKTSNEHNKASGSALSSKSNLTHHVSKRGTENQDPSASERGASTGMKMKGVSRLPVLAKSLQHPTSTNFNQMRWEERPLLGKEKRKKACTKPQPFNLTQPRTSRLPPQREEQGITGNTRTPASSQHNQLSLAKAQRSFPTKAKTVSTSPCLTALLDPGILCTNSVHSNGLKAQAVTLSGQALIRGQSFISRQNLRNTENQPPDSYLSSHSLSENVSTDKTATQMDAPKDISAYLGGITLGSSNHGIGANDMSKGSGQKSSSNAPHHQVATLKVATKTQSQTSQSTNNNTDGFCPDPSALYSILHSVGITANGAQAGVTPRPSVCPSGRGTSVYLPQRVALLKSAQRLQRVAKAGKVPSGTSDSPVYYEVSKLGGTTENITPRASVCPPTRASSIYTAQRVPLSKTRTIEESTTKAIPLAFSADPTALNSILQDEGIQPGSITPYAPACSSQRPSYIGTAQRVPVSRCRTQKPPGQPRRSPSPTQPVKWTPKRVPSPTQPVKYTPQRVPNSKPRSMRHMSAYRTPKFVGSPANQTPKSSALSKSPPLDKDRVVQRLFEEGEEEEKMEDEEELPSQDTDESPEQEKDVCSLVKGEVEMPEPPVQRDGGQSGPFLQPAHRDSVIVLSSGERLFGQTPAKVVPPPTPQTQEPYQHPNTQPVTTLPPRPPKQPMGFVDPTSGSSETRTVTRPTPLCQRKVLDLRRRLASWEEMILDDECATYTSQPYYCASLPRSFNPVARTLLSCEINSFRPIEETSLS